MTQLIWDKTGERFYETGVDHGVLYVQNSSGLYPLGVAWNGLTAVTESPSGAESNAQYADNIKYLNLVSAEEFGATIEAFTYPDEFGVCDGTAMPETGVRIGQQTRRQFGFSYRTLKGNDVAGNDLGYLIHLVYACLAAPSEKAYNTVNDSPEPITFSWEVSTTPTAVGTIGGVSYKPTATITIDSTAVNAADLKDLEDIIYGTVGQDPRLPLPAEVIAIFDTGLTEVTPTPPSFDTEEDEITIPVVTGVIYSIDGADVTGVIPITVPTLVVARPAAGYKFPAVVDNDWLFTPVP